MVKQEVAKRAAEKTASIGVRLRPEVREAAFAIAKERHQTLSQWVEMLIERELATREPKKRR